MARRPTWWSEERKAACLGLLPSGLIFIVFVTFPLIYSFYLSFHHWSILSPAMEFAGFANYAEAFTSPAARNAFRVTLIYAGVSVPLLAGLSLGMALLLRGPIRGGSAYRTAFFSPVVLSTTVTAIIWSWAFDPHFGLANYGLSLLGIQGPNWLVDPRWALPALVITTLWKYAGFYMVIFIAGLQAIPQAYYEAAKIDGAGWASQLTHVTLPLLRRAGAFVVVMATINAFQTFGLVFVMTGGGPMDSTNLVVHYLYREAFQFFRMGYASAIAWLLFIALFSLALIQVRYIGSGGRVREG